jgi:ubiquinone/menaquinone biosynthesis C-methylase UbiE
MADQYHLSNTDRERERLASQGAALRPATERLFRAAGIGPGARVLDCGSGGGDVSIIAAELVTSSGEVVGIDRDPAHLDAASRRVADLGLSNVRFQTADISDPAGGPFDAIVGRLVLMYQPDPEAVLRALAGCLRPGGVMAFIEYEHARSCPLPMWPRSPMADQLDRWVDEAFDVLGTQHRMATRLPSLMRSAGLEPQPPFELTGAVYTGATVVEHLTALMKGVSKVLVDNGIATAEEIAIETFTERISAELGPDPVLVSGPDIAVWAKKPMAHND